MQARSGAAIELSRKVLVVPILGASGHYVLRATECFILGIIVNKSLNLEYERPIPVLETLIPGLHACERAVRLFHIIASVNALAAPFCCHQLAHLGAKVIKVEEHPTTTAGLDSLDSGHHSFDQLMNVDVGGGGTHC